MIKKNSLIFCLIILRLSIIYPQLIDNRDLPPEQLRIRPPFEATDRSVVASKDDRVFIVLDNADDIKIQEFTDSDTTEAVMLGNVRIRFDGSFLRAEKMIITMKDSLVINVGAYGNVEFTLAGTKYLVDSLNYQPDMERGVMYNVRSILGASPTGGYNDKPWYYRAEKATILSSDRFVLDNVQLSTSDVRFDHFALKVSKLWYIQGKVTVAAGLEYMTGQASFLWLPVFLQTEGSGGLRTSFGSEKRIGYYFINNIAVDSKIGEFDFGFDFYERQGQYFQMDYAAPKIGMIQYLEIQTRFANDVRIIKNGDLFSQWVQPQLNAANDFQQINQFAWYYKIRMAIATNGISLDFDIEDLNDPFFLPKYSARTRFDDAESINFTELLNPSLNSWYGYQGDANPSLNTIKRSFNLRAGQFSMSGAWELLQITRPNQKNNANQFLNNYYDYELRSLTLPSITYNFGSLNLAKYAYTTTNRVTVVRSDGKSNTMSLAKLPEYEKQISQISNRSIRRGVVLLGNGTYQTNMITNWTTVSIDTVITNQYTWVDLALTASADVKYSAQRTFGTNSSTTVQDINLLNTNWVVIADVNQHQENGSLDFRTALFDNLWTIDNKIKMQYNELWSSFGANFTNSQRDSGFRMDYTLGTSVKPDKIWDDDEWYRTKIAFETSVSYSYPLYYLLRMQNDFVRESFITWNNTFSWEWLQWQRQPILGLTFDANWNLRHRVPTDEQQNIINGDTNNIYFDNKIYDRLTLGAKARVFWFNIGTEATVDILNTKTNNSEENFRPLAGASFTNRFVGGYPKLLFEFTPDSKYHYLPKLVYRYNLFEKARIGIVTNHNNEILPTVFRTDKSFNLEFLWDVRLRNYQIPALYPFIYELSEFGFVLQYYQDFINVRNSYLRLDFVIGVKFTKYLTFRFSSQMLNEKIYLYYKNGIYNGESILAPGENPKNFFGDLWNGLKIWDVQSLQSSSFKLQALNFELIHDLDTWDMRIIFNLGRRVDEIKQVAFWEPYVGVAFTMKGANAANIFPEFQRRFVPAEYQ
ncbi:MAG: hypothetical protein ACRCWI_06555 [Brevinema sp.]